MASATATPLSSEDRAILDLERATVAGHTCKVVRLAAGGPTCEQLRARIAQRIAAVPMLRRRLDRSAGGEPVWMDARDFAVADHVVPYDQGGPLGPVELRRVVADLFEQRLDRDRPLWRMDIIELHDGERAIVWRLHRALADAAAAVRYARALLWDDGAGIRAAPRRARADDEARRRAQLAGYLRREFGRPHAGSPLDGPTGTRRDVGFCTVSLSGLRRAARDVQGATLNDAVLAVVSGALRDWLQARHGPLGVIRIQVPVSLQPDEDAEVDGDSPFTLALPLGEADPMARLRAIRADTDARISAHDAGSRALGLTQVRDAFPRLRRFAATRQRSPLGFALSVSTVAGPELRARVFGTAVTELYALAEVGARHALRISIISMGGTLGFGLCADADLLPDVQTMAAAIPAQAQALAQRVAAA